jgi:hypothetical protein
MLARLFAAGLFASMVTSGLSAESLADRVSEAKADWMFGKWEAETDNGDKVSLNISWDLDKKVVVLHVKTGEMESKGYTAMDPESSEAKYISFDNRGSVGKGTWGMESEELVLRTEAVTAEGQKRKMGFVFAGSASEGLQVRMHSIGSSGDLDTPARMTLKFKKQK